MDCDNVVFRIVQHPDMKVNQFLIVPHFGSGVPHEE